MKHLGIETEDRASEKALNLKKCDCCETKVPFFRKICNECLQILLEPILKLK